MQMLNEGDKDDDDEGEGESNEFVELIDDEVIDMGDDWKSRNSSDLSRLYLVSI